MITFCGCLGVSALDVRSDHDTPPLTVLVLMGMCYRSLGTQVSVGLVKRPVR